MKCTHNEHFFVESKAESICDCGLYTQHSYQNYVMLRAENVGLLRENMDLRARLYDQGQHPGFPQPPAGGDDVELYIDRQAQAELMGFGDDEPVAGTA